MVSLWIVHRDARQRTALARLAAAPQDALRAAPGDPALDTAPPARVVLLGLAGDFEAELQFAHRQGARLRDAGWVLVAERDQLDRARRLFDSLDAEILGFAPDPRLLRERIIAAGRGEAAPLALSQRPARDALRERFTRWFADLELPELLRAVDPRLADLPLLMLGEPGSGRGLLARYVHAFGSHEASELRGLSCTAATTRPELLQALAPPGPRPRVARACSVLLEDVDRLAPELQREILAWVEFGVPPGVVAAERVRWIGTAESDELGSGLDPGLGRALSGLRLRIPPLRERLRAVEAFVDDTARHWCGRRQLPPRHLDEDALRVLREYPWPGNLRELEALVEQSLAACDADPLGVADLVLDGTPFAPLDAAELGEALDDPEDPGPPPEPPPGPPAAAEPAGEEAEPPDPEPFAEAELLDESESGEPFEPAPAAEPLPDPGPPAPALPDASPEGADPDARLRRLAGALAHEVRNPLTAIRSFAALLPERYGDSEFRGRFAGLVSEGVERIEDVVERLERLAALAPPRPARVDMQQLLDELLRERRDAIRRRRLLVLKELEGEQPFALGDPEQLRFAFEALLNQSLELVPDRGDLYCASRYHPTGLGEAPALRVLLRYRGGQEASGQPTPHPGLAPAENALEFVIAEAVIRAQGGSFALDAGDAETVVVVDLPAPGRL